MLNKILYNLIKIFIYLVKYFKSDRFFDKVIFNIGLKQLIENTKYYDEFIFYKSNKININCDLIIDYILNKLSIV